MKPQLHGMIVLAVVVGLTLCASAAIYDDFDDDGVWAYPSGTSPDGKWNYNYNNDPSWATIQETNGVMYMNSVMAPGQLVQSTQSWAMPQHSGEALIFEFKVSNTTYNGANNLTWHEIDIVGDVTTFKVRTDWGNTFWNLQDQWSAATAVPYPTDEAWDVVRITFSQTDTGKFWKVEFEDAAGMNLGTYERTLYAEYAAAMSQNTTAMIQLYSDYGRAKYDYVDVTFVPEPATIGLLAVGGLSVLARRKRK